MNKLLEVKNLSLSYPEFSLHPLSFSLDYGEILAVVGESGSGKTTLLKGLSCLWEEGVKVSGQVLLEGRELLEMRSSAGSCACAPLQWPSRTPPPGSIPA